MPIRLANREQPDTLTMVAWKEPLPDGGFGPRERHYVAVDALLTDEAIEAMVLAAATPVHDDGHTDTYYRGLMQAAITAASSEKQAPS